MATTASTTKRTARTTAKPAAKTAPKAATRKPVVRKAAAVKLPEIKLPDVKMPEFKMPEFKLPDMSALTKGFDFSSLDAGKLADLDDKLVAAVRDAAYITVGFGVLAVQQAQVRRRELVKALSERFGASRTQVDDMLSSVEAQLAKLDERFDALEAKLDTTVEQLEGRLPDQAAAFVGQAHDFAKAARKQVRGLIRTAA